MEMLVRGGTVVNAEGAVRADVAVSGGVIAAVGENLAPAPGAEIVEAEGLLVLPGAVDAHTHLALDAGGLVSSDDYFTGTRAAVCGGTTTVFDFATQEAGEAFPDTIRRRRAMAEGEACVDFAFHLAVTDASRLSTLADCAAEGVTSAKAYMVYDFALRDAELSALFAEAARLSMLVQVHAENRAELAARVRRFLDAGLTDAYHHYLSRDESVESEAVARALSLADAAGAPVYIVHLACAEGVRAVMRAKAAGRPVLAETCPQYLYFTNEVYARPDARAFVCSPPVKGEASRAALWRAVAEGAIDTVATDHCPFARAEKDRGAADFTKIPNGCGGVEQRYPYLLGEACAGRLSYARAVALCAENPARIFGIADRKGALRPGLDADIALYNPRGETVVRAAFCHGAADHTIWEGARFPGAIERVFLRGREAFRDGRFTGARGAGRYLYRGPSGPAR